LDKRKVLGSVGMLVHACYLRDARVRRQAEFLADEGFDVHVVSAKSASRTNGCVEPNYEIVNKVHIHRLPLRKKRGSKLRYVFEFVSMTILGAWKITLLHLRKKFKVVHIHNMPDFLVVAGLISRWLGAHLVLDIHDPMSELFQQTYDMKESHPMIKVIKLQERLGYKLAESLLTVSIPMAENIAKKRGCAVDTIRVLHNFPNLKLFPVHERQKPWPYNSNNIVFLYSGTVTEHYRLDTAIRAFAMVSRQIPNIRFQILGDGNRLQEVLVLARSLGIGDKVELLQSVSQDKVKDVMRKVDVGITTHDSGVFGDLYFSTKIIEFMTQGLPVISSRTHTIDKYIPEDSIVYFVPGNAEDLAKQIIRVCTNHEFVREKISNSRKLLAKYTWQGEQGKFLTFYEEIMGLHHILKQKRSEISNSR